MARSVRDRIEMVWDQELEPDLRRYQVAAARQVLAEEQLRGFDERPRRIVDRRYDAPLDSVRFGGTIEFIARGDIAALLRWIWEEIVRRSPVLTGRYKSSHLIMLNGTSVGSDPEAVIRQMKSGDRIQIVNTQPYAKKIEGRARSRTGGAAVRGQSKQAPNGVYRAVYASAKRRYNKVAMIDFTYVKLDTGLTVMGFQGGGKNRKRMRRPAVFPAIKLFQSASAREGSPG